MSKKRNIGEEILGAIQEIKHGNGKGSVASVKDRWKGWQDE